MVLAQQERQKATSTGIITIGKVAGQEDIRRLRLHVPNLSVPQHVAETHVGAASGSAGLRVPGSPVQGLRFRIRRTEGLNGMLPLQSLNVKSSFSKKSLRAGLQVA